MLQLDQNVQRNLKRLPSGEFAASKDGTKNVPLCLACGAQPRCRLFKDLAKVHWAAITVIRCQKFVPVIGFRAPIVGLDRTFNTMRLGKSWSERLKPGDFVALTDTKDDSIIGHARVTHVEVGAFDTMVWAHGAENHLVVDSPKGRNACIEEVRHVLKKSYGKFITPDSLLTAIYLSRVNLKEVPRP